MSRHAATIERLKKSGLVLVLEAPDMSFVAYFWHSKKLIRQTRTDPKLPGTDGRPVKSGKIQEQDANLPTHSIEKL